MKTLGIAAGILTVTGILGWIVVQTLKSDNSDSAYNMHPSNFEKPDMESTIKYIEQQQEADPGTLDLTKKPDEEDEKNA